LKKKIEAGSQLEIESDYKQRGAAVISSQTYTPWLWGAAPSSPHVLAWSSVEFAAMHAAVADYSCDSRNPSELQLQMQKIAFMRYRNQ
jgi:hypothetical protein